MNIFRMLLLLLFSSLATALTATTPLAEAFNIEDRLAIQDILTRYAHSVDSRDWDLYQTVFTNDAIIDYRNAGGHMGDVTTISKWLRGVLGTKDGDRGMFAFQLHSITNIEVVFHDDQHATVRAMFYNPMAVRGLPLSFSIGGWYNHEMVKLKGEWKSKHLWEDICYNNFLVSVVGQLIGTMYIAFKVFASVFRLIARIQGTKAAKPKND